MNIAQTTMIAASLALLVYIAVIVSGSFVSQSTTSNDPAFLRSEADAVLRKQLIESASYVHGSDIGGASMNIPLSGITLRDGEFLFLFDSTPYASKGHIAFVLPCDENNLGVPLFQLLTGRAPDLLSHPPTYLPQLSSPPDTCVYHAQFGFGDPVTDLALKNVSGQEVTFRGPHTVVLTAHESYLPEAASPLGH
ncbi:MAG: hypothetical protein ACRD5H_17590 [Nitrososphaerales archaeon]